jgi:hypothetical protein
MAKRKSASGYPSTWKVLTRGKSPADARGLVRELAKLEKAKGGAAKFKAVGSDVQVKNNPAGGFAKCVAAVSKRKGVKSPAGVCATVGRKKYGAKGFQKLAAAGKCKKKAARKNKSAGARQQIEKEYQRDALKKSMRKRGRRRNPAGDGIGSAAERYEYFHGKAPDKVVEITTPIYQPSETSGIGKLVKLVVKRVDGKGLTDIVNFKGSLLSQNVEGTQLYIDGGDQRVRLEDFGIKRDSAHVNEVLGTVAEVWYDTEKLHLGDDGGDAIYHHKFGARGKRLPFLFYDVRNKLLMFAGGGYDLPAEGIRR